MLALATTAVTVRNDRLMLLLMGFQNQISQPTESEQRKDRHHPDHPAMLGMPTV